MRDPAGKCAQGFQFLGVNKFEFALRLFFLRNPHLFDGILFFLFSDFLRFPGRALSILKFLIDATNFERVLSENA